MNIVIVPGNEETYSIFRIHKLTKDTLVVQRYDIDGRKYYLDNESDAKYETFCFDEITIIHWNITFNKDKTFPAKDLKVIQMCPFFSRTFVSNYGRKRKDME